MINTKTLQCTHILPQYPNIAFTPKLFVQNETVSIETVNNLYIRNLYSHMNNTPFQYVGMLFHTLLLTTYLGTLKHSYYHFLIPLQLRALYSAIKHTDMEEVYTAVK